MVRRLRPIDLLVLLLALASAGLVLYQVLGHPTAGQHTAVQRLEWGIIALFALEFLFALVRHDHRVAYAVRNWYEVLALIPVTAGPHLDWAIFPALRIAVLVARFGRVVDRLFGDEAFHRMVARARSVVVEWVADAVTLRVLDETLAVLDKAAFTRNLADALEQHGHEMDEVLLEKVRADPAIARFRGLPFFDDVLALTGTVGRRIAVETLRDERMAQLVRGVVRDNVRQIRDEVRRLDSLAARA